MPTNEPGYMRQYQARRRAEGKPLQPLQDEPLHEAEPLQDVKDEPVKDVVLSSLRQNIAKWSWCYTNSLPSQQWIANHKREVESSGVTC